MDEFDLDRFRCDGVAAIRHAFTADEAAAMRDAIWRRVESQTTARRDDPSSWTGVRLPSFKPLKQRGVFRAASQSVAVTNAFDGIFGPGGWEPSASGVQVLVTLPNATTWTLPHHLWHMDTGFAPTVPTTMVKVFCCVDVVEPGGGGTLALAGSHRLVDLDVRNGPDGVRDGNSASWGKFLRRDEWTRELITPGNEPERTARLMDASRVVDDVRLHVVEMTGQPGDAYVTDIHTFHCVAPNARLRPRLMLAAVARAA